MIKTVLFDLDGVLWNSREMHFDVLNEALEKVSPAHVISLSEHLKVYNGLTTRTKLSMLSQTNGLDPSLHDTIHALKQDLTISWMERNVHPDVDRLSAVMEKLWQHDDEIKLGVVSNSVSRTVKTFLKRSELANYFDIIISNEDCEHPKPSPSPYLQAMAKLGVSPYETLIVEDSPIGIDAAVASGANVMHVQSPDDVTWKNVELAMMDAKATQRSLIVPRLNVVVPMAGQGSRFVAAGYQEPKPFIDVEGKTMIENVVDSLGFQLGFSTQLTFIVRDENQSKRVRNLVRGACKPLIVPSLTEGAACTVLLAKYRINNECPLLIVNSDQMVEWSYVEAVQRMNTKGADACILTFEDVDPKWSFAELDDDGYVKRVAEKQPISNKATCGLYLWRRGSDFCKFANEMIKANDRVNGEFYVCPVFNHAIAAGLKVVTYDVKKMWGLGTPEDLERYLNRDS